MSWKTFAMRFRGQSGIVVESIFNYLEVRWKEWTKMGKANLYGKESFPTHARPDCANPRDAEKSQIWKSGGDSPKMVVKSIIRRDYGECDLIDVRNSLTTVHADELAQTLLLQWMMIPSCMTMESEVSAMSILPRVETCWTFYMDQETGE